VKGVELTRTVFYISSSYEALLVGRASRRIGALKLTAAASGFRHGQTAGLFRQYKSRASINLGEQASDVVT
jgi:hypothetical protein